MTQQQTKAYIQFSKKLVMFIAVCWQVFRLACLCQVYFRPETSESLIKFLTGSDDIMIASIGFYTGNSVFEKGVTGYFTARGAEYKNENNQG